jgi:hypothetical protein
MRERVSDVGFLGTECSQCFSTLANVNIWNIEKRLTGNPGSLFVHVNI